MSSRQALDPRGGAHKKKVRIRRYIANVEGADEDGNVSLRPSQGLVRLHGLSDDEDWVFYHA